MKTVIYDHQIFSQQKFGGISRYFCEIASRIQARAGWRSRVVAPVFFNKYLADSDVQVQGLYIPAPYQRIERVFDLLNRKMEPYFLSRSGADVLHQTYYSSTIPVCPATRVVTVFDMIHELYPQYFTSRDLVIREYKRQAVDNASHVVCISQKTADDLITILQVPPEKITVTYLGFSSIFESSIEKQTETQASPTRRPYLLYVGNRGGYKNFGRLVEAFASSKKMTAELDLIAFGGPSFTRSDFHIFKKFGLRPDAIIQKYGDDAALSRLYSAARAFVYPSEYEGFGIPLLEAMASGCPVACSDQSCMPEIVGEAAEYFNPTQIDSIRSALEALTFDETRRFELISAGRERCRLFSWRRCAEETLGAYEKALG